MVACGGQGVAQGLHCFHAAGGTAGCTMLRGTCGVAGAHEATTGPVGLAIPQDSVVRLQAAGGAPTYARAAGRQRGSNTTVFRHALVAVALSMRKAFAFLPSVLGDAGAAGP
jgi:hypothetical protein